MRDRTTSARNGRCSRMGQEDVMAEIYQDKSADGAHHSNRAVLAILAIIVIALVIGIIVSVAR